METCQSLRDQRAAEDIRDTRDLWSAPIRALGFLRSIGVVQTPT